MAARKKAAKPDDDTDAVTTLGAIGRLAQMPDAIRRVDLAIKRLKMAGLARRTIVLLLHDTTKVSRRDINAILDALPTLAERYLTDGK